MDTEHGLHPHQQFSALSRLYPPYRLVLAAFLMLLFSINVEGVAIGRFDPTLFAVVNGLYLITAAAQLVQMLIASGGKFTPLPIRVNFFVIDIVALVALAHASDLVESDLVLLLWPAIATANVFYSDLRGTFLAALATLLLLVDMLLQINVGQQSVQDLPSVAMLGAFLFLTASAIHALSKRSFAALRLADIRAADIKQLEEINQQIVNDLQTGVILLGNDGTVRLANPVAANLLGLYLPSKNNQAVPAPGSLLKILSSDEPIHYITGMENQELRVSVIFPETGEDRLLFIDNMATLHEEAQQIKLASMGRLTASIAHEIRNPLGAISHAAQLLEESALAEGDLRLLQIVKEQSTRLNGVVINILEMTKQKQATPKRIDLRKWTERFVEDFVLTNPSVNINLSIADNEDGSEDTFTVDTDPGHLQQVLVNLVNNGLRFSESESGERSLTLQLWQSLPNKSAVLDVIDCGKGVSPEERQKIFEPFYTTSDQGNGLGLYVCKQLCNSNRIGLSYQLTKNDESCFRLNFERPEKVDKFVSLDHDPHDQNLSNA